MVETTSIVLVFIAFMGFSIKRLMTYMHVLQQEEYDTGRLLKWIFAHNAFDKRLSLALIAMGLIWTVIQFYMPFVPILFMNFLVFICLTLTAYIEKDPRKNSKKKLVATSRAKRTFFPAYIVILAMAVPSFYYPHPLPWIFVIQLIPFVLIGVSILLKPIEDIIQQLYWNEAHEKFMALKPKTIAITGSFGKTSVKHILGHILKTQAPTLITPGSVNTPMGITRIIREQLGEEHKYFIVEMGAYGPGSIERLCRLTPPDMGIITAIGHAHYERFRSLETVAQTKFELANDVVSREGSIIIHERTLRFPYPRHVKFDSLQNFIVVGEPPEIDPHKRKDISYLQKDDLHIQKIIQTTSGLEVRLTWKEQVYIFEVPLFGLHHGHNAALAFAAALELGVPLEAIYQAFETLPQINHRLEVKKQPGGITFIDDAYNSNPLGFRSALDLMAMLKTGRTILITPGMIELGNAHDEAHQKIGQYAGQVCDVAIVINAKRIPTFVKGFQSSGSSKTLIEVDSFQDAARWLEDNKQSGDIILIENDLPDMYERIPIM